MLLNQAFDQRKSDSAAFPVFVCLIETFEDTRLLLRRDSDTRIFYRESETIFLFPDGKCYCSAVRGELESVGKQVGHYHLHVGFIYREQTAVHF